MRCLLPLALLLPVLATAAEMRGYSLFNPVPERGLRELNTDRPDKTNGPVTLDAGHFQVEMDMLNYARDGHGQAKQETWLWGNTNFRIGLCDQADLQLMVPFIMDDGQTTGVGDLTVAVKTNLWGNNGGDSAAAIEVFITTPTGKHGLSGDTVEAGLLGIYDRPMGSFDVSFNSGVGILGDDDGSGHHAQIVNAVSISHALFGQVSGYMEFFTSVPTTHSQDWIGTVDTGVLWQLSKNVQFDTGINVGVTHAADDLQVFLGLSWRI
jgi:hypothetical protein